MSQLARSSNPPKESAIEALPAHYRKDLALLCGALSDGLRGQVGVATLFSVWIKDHGLTPKDVNGIVSQMLQPREVARLQFPMSIIARLAELVEKVVADRRAAAETSARRRPPANTVARVDWQPLAQRLTRQ
jgi:hypothetical protein